jgi:DNA-directed RNA polymerase specialized sigma subunit
VEASSIANESFIPYASIKIRGAVLDELRRMDWMSRSGRSRAKQLDTLISRIEQEQGCSVGPEQLCEELDISGKELNVLMDQVHPIEVISLDVPKNGKRADIRYMKLSRTKPGFPLPRGLNRKS